MKKNTWIGIVVIVIVILLIIILPVDDKKVLNEKELTLQIGSIESLSGNASYYGEQSKKGVDLAQEELEDIYPNLNLEIYHQDSLYTPKGGVDAYQLLNQQYDLDAVITYASPVSIAIQPLAERDGILQMAVSSSASAYSTADDLSFRTSASTNLEAIPMAEYIKNKNYKKLAIFYFQNDIGVSVANSLTKELEDEKMLTEVVVNEGFVTETTDFRTLLSKAKQSQADTIYFVGLASQIANALNQASEIGINVPFLGFRTVEDPVLIENAPKTAEGIVYTYAFDPESSEKMIKDFSNSFQKKYGYLPEGYAAEAYLGLKLTVESFIECGKDYTCIKDYLSTLKEYPSIFGPLSFDTNGDVFYDFFLKTVKEGEFVKLEE